MAQATKTAQRLGLVDQLLLRNQHAIMLTLSAMIRQNIHDQMVRVPQTRVEASEVKKVFPLLEHQLEATDDAIKHNRVLDE